MKPNQAGASYFGLMCGLIITLAWSAAFLFLDGTFAISIVQAIQSLDFVPVEGKVLRCEVKKTPSDEGYSWAVDIDYTYLVDNERYVGNRFRFGPSSPSQQGVEKFVEEHPVDGAITVYYDPTNPENVVVMQGLSNSAILEFLFLWPFNLVMLLAWAYFAMKCFLSRRSLLRIGYGVRVIENASEIRVRLPKRGPWY